MLTLDKTGRQICAINDKPHFHDISEVPKPAERIAFGLRKVASDGAVLTEEEEQRVNIWLPLSVMNKIASFTPG